MEAASTVEEGCRERKNGQQIVSKNIFQKMDTVFIKVIVLKIYLWAILFKVYMIMARNSVCEEFFKHFEN